MDFSFNLRRSSGPSFRRAIIRNLSNPKTVFLALSGTSLSEVIFTSTFHIFEICFDVNKFIELYIILNQQINNLI